MSPLDLLWLCFIVISLQPPYPRASKQPHLVAPAVSRAALRQEFGGTVEPDCCAAHLITARLGEQPILGAAGHRRPARACRLHLIGRVEASHCRPDRWRQQHPDRQSGEV